MNRRRLLTAALVVLVAATGYVWGRAFRSQELLRVTFLDVGQGDAAVIETPGGRTLLLDAGSADQDNDRGRSVVMPYLRSRGINRLDALMLTHWDQDHAGGAASVLEGVRTSMLVLPRPPGPSGDPTATEQDVLAAAKRKQISPTYLSAGQQLRTGDGVFLWVVNPPPPHYRPSPVSDNEASLVLLLTYGQTRILFTGDAGAEAEHGMVRRNMDVCAEILKVGHHGSASSTTEGWLNAVRPKVAVISVGKGNPFGHPDASVIQRLTRRGVHILRTDQTGAVTVLSDGRECRVSTYRRQTPDHRLRVWRPAMRPVAHGRRRPTEVRRMSLPNPRTERGTRTCG